MSCKSSLCLRCAKVHVDNWVSQVSQVLHEGVIYRHIILTVPAMFRTTFYQNAAVVLPHGHRSGRSSWTVVGGKSAWRCPGWPGFPPAFRGVVVGGRWRGFL